MAGINKLSMALYNRTTALKCFYQKGKLSKKELSELLSLSLPAMSSILSDLENEGFLLSTGKLEKSYGHHQGYWFLSPTKYTYICISVSALSINSIVVDTTGTPLNSVSRREYFIQHKEDLIDEIINEISRLKLAFPSVNRIAISCYGIVNMEEGELTFMPRLIDREPIPLREIIEQTVGIPTMIDNAPNTYALAEKWTGSKYKDYVWLNIDRSIGCGIVMDNNVYRGHCCTAGEIGHITVQSDGPPCVCGNKGCIDSYANLFAILKMYFTLDPSKGLEVHYEDPTKRNDIELLSLFAEAIKNGEPPALQTLDKLAQYLSYGILSIINTMSPSHIFIGGKMSVIGQPLLEYIDRYLKENQIYKILHTGDEMELSSMSSEQLIAGAFYLWVEKDLTQHHKE